MGFTPAYGIGSLKPGVCTSTTRPAVPFDGQVIYMTDVDQTAVWDGTSWVGLDLSRDRNVIINGAMQIAQRGTSTAGIGATAGYFTADRFYSSFAAALSTGRFTQSIEADAPTGSGFRKSLKMLVTTASTLAVADRITIQQPLEGQNVQKFCKGTASAKQFSVSFWVKSNLTGTYICELVDTDNTRQVSASYTISSSATWEKKTIIFPADTTGALDNDNAVSLRLNFGLGSGTNFTSGTLQTTWAATVSANRDVGQVNLLATLNNYWQVTGIQLEAGAVATPFEFEDIGTTLAKCQRYYQRVGGNGLYEIVANVGVGTSTTLATILVQHIVPLRAQPSALEFSTLGIGVSGVSFTAVSAVSFDQAGTVNSAIIVTSTSLTSLRPYFLQANNSLSAYLAFTAEL